MTGIPVTGGATSHVPGASATPSVPGEYGEYAPAPIPVPEVTDVPVETKDSNPTSNTPIDLTGSSDSALPTGAVGVVGDPTEIGNNPVYEAVVPTGPVDTNVHSSVLPADQWSSSTVVTPTGQEVPIFGPGTKE